MSHREAALASAGRRPRLGTRLLWCPAEGPEATRRKAGRVCSKKAAMASAASRRNKMHSCRNGDQAGQTGAVRRALALGPLATFVFFDPVCLRMAVGCTVGL